MSREGFWHVTYEGEAGGGFAILVFDTGRVIGAGVLGATFDGTYEHDPRAGGQRFDVKCTATKQDTPLAQGTILRKGDTFRIQGVLPTELASVIVELQTDRGPVRAAFEKLRDFSAGS